MNSSLKKRYLICFLFAALITSCSKTESEIENLNGGHIGIVGHGGNGFQSERNPLPHNSYSSIIKAVEAYHSDGVELDIQLSKDHQLILYHDNTLESMTDCKGCIRNKTSHELIKCKYKNDFFMNAYSEEYITKFEDILERFSKRNPKPLLFLDIVFDHCHNKTDKEMNIFMDVLNQTILKYNGLDWIFILSTQSVFLQALKIINPSIKLIIEGGNADEIIYTAKKNGYYGIINRNEFMTKEDIKEAHLEGLSVYLFDVKTRSGTIAAINKHPDFIITENILLLQQCMKKY